MADRIRNPQQLDASPCVTLQSSAADVATPVSANVPHCLFLLDHDSLQCHERIAPNQCGDLILYIPATGLLRGAKRERSYFPHITRQARLLVGTSMLARLGRIQIWFDSPRTVGFECLNAQASSGTRTLRSIDQERFTCGLFPTWHVRVVWQGQEICRKHAFLDGPIGSRVPLRLPIGAHVFIVTTAPWNDDSLDSVRVGQSHTKTHGLP
jgi:hypothetical protein